ncbi:MAG: hypothetical protein WD696_04985 [Bryobacteraceae bacterium]
MKRLTVAFVLVLSVFAISAAAADMTGYITDAACANKKGVEAVSSDAHAGCAQGCAKKGQALVFVTDGKILKISDTAKVQDHVGHKVTITGKVEGDTITVDSVKM